MSTNSKEYMRAYYAAHVPWYKAKKRRISDKARVWIEDYLASHPCEKCGERDPRCLDFHHARGKKRFNVSSGPHMQLSLSSIEEEALKCDVLCANCHRKLHSRKSTLARDWD